MGRKALQRHEIFTGGQNLSFEPERLRPVELKESKNVDIADDGLPEAAPGYELFLTIPKRRQLATMEDTFDGSGESWTGDATLDPALGAADTPTHRRYGFFARNHTHAGAGSLAGVLVRDLSFLNDFVAGDAFKLFVFVTTRANLSDFKVRLEKDAANYFEADLDASIPAGDNTGTNLSWLRSSMSQTGALTWAEVAQVRIMSTATGATLISFNDLYIESATATDPVTGIHSFQIPGDAKKYLMVATSDMVYSEENGSLTKRDAKLQFKSMVHFETANDMAVWVNGSENPRRWLPAEVSSRDVGVPAPALGSPAFVGTDAFVAGGAVAAGTYSAKVTFDMGVHGEGNPSAPSASFAVAAPPAGANAINYTNVPIGPPGTVKRLIYRSSAGNPGGPWMFDVAINNNTATTAQSLNADSSLGDEVTTNGGKPPVLRFISKGGGKLWGVPKTLPSFIRHSDKTFLANRTIEQWDPLDELRSDASDGDVLVGISAHREFVYPVKRKSLFVIDPRANAIRKISNVYGAISQRSIADTGFSLRMWSSRFGPLDLVGTDVRELGRKVKNTDGLYPGVEDVSANITRPPVAGSPIDKIFDTKADWEQAGTVATNISTTEILGSFIPAPDDSFSRTVNLAFRRASALNDGGDLEIVGSGSSALDGDTTTGFLVNQLGTGTGTATINITLAQAKTINRVEVVVRNAKDAAETTVLSSIDVRTRLGAGSQILRAQAAGPAISGLKTFVFRFTRTDADSVRIDFMKGVDLYARFDVLEIRVFERGYKIASSWESPKIDLGVDPYEYLKVDGNVLSVVPNDIQIFMKSATTANGLDTAPYAPVVLAAPPDPATVPANQHVRFKVFLYSNGREAPRVDSLMLSFNVANTNLLPPVFESAAIFFEGRYWLNYVPRNQTTNSGLWKIGRFQEAGEHNDYQFSCWTVHDGVLYAGSAVAGEVYRNVRNLQNRRLTSKAGRAVRSVLETPRTDLGEQMTTKSIRGFIVAARNEAEGFPELLTNGSLEDWTAFPTGPGPITQASLMPTAWEIVPGPAQPFGVALQRENSRLYVNTGLFSARMDGTRSGVNVVPVYMRQFVTLLNSTPYELRFWMKNVGDPGRLLIQADDNRILEFTNGTWVIGNPYFSLPDVGNSWTEVVLSFTTPSDITSALPVRFQFEYEPLGVPSGTTWLDDISMRQAQTRVRRLLILPILDGVAVYPERVMDLVNARRTGIVEERFRIDRAGVRNLGYRVRQEDVDGGFKLFGILTEFEIEEMRKEERF